MLNARGLGLKNQGWITVFSYRGHAPTRRTNVESGVMREVKDEISRGILLFFDRPTQVDGWQMMAHWI